MLGSPLRNGLAVARPVANLYWESHGSINAVDHVRLAQIDGNPPEYLDNVARLRENVLVFLIDLEAHRFRGGENTLDLPKYVINPPTGRWLHEYVPERALVVLTIFWPEVEGDGVFSGSDGPEIVIFRSIFFGSSRIIEQEPANEQAEKKN